MAEFNELGDGRPNRLLQGRFNTEGERMPSPTLGGDISPVFQIEPPGPEHSSLRSEVLWGVRCNIAAVAAQVTYLSVANTSSQTNATTGVLATVDRVILAFGGTQTVRLGMSTNAALRGNLIIPGQRDRRLGNRFGVIAFGSDTAIGPSIPPDIDYIAELVALASTDVRLEDGVCVLAPGESLHFITLNTNVQVIATVWGRARLINPSENTR